MIIEKGANYGYPLREGTQAMTPQGMTPVPADDTIPVQITDTIARGTVKPTYPVIAYPHTASGGDADGRRLRLPRPPDSGAEGQAGLRRHHHRPHLVRGDGRRPQAPTTATPTTVAPMHELDAGVRRPGRSRPTAPAAGRATPCPAPPPSPAAAAWISVSPRTRPASSTC